VGLRFLVVPFTTAFLKWMKEYKKQMITCNCDGNILSQPTGIDFAAGTHPLVAITQDESTFPMNDQQYMKWDHGNAKRPEAKNEGPTIMILGMMTEEWGELKYGNRCVIIFPPICC
jgi:hypothetical protein